MRNISFLNFGTIDQFLMSQLTMKILPLPSRSIFSFTKILVRKNDRRRYTNLTTWGNDPSILKRVMPFSQDLQIFCVCRGINKLLELRPPYRKLYSRLNAPQKNENRLVISQVCKRFSDAISEVYLISQPNR